MLVSAASTVIISSDQQPNPINCIYLNPPRFRGGAVREAASIERSVDILLNFSVIRSAVSTKDSHPSSVISKGHNSEDTQDSEPAVLWSYNPAGHTAVLL